METPDKVSFASGVKLEKRQSYVSVNNGEIVEERVELLSKISKNIIIANTQTLKMITGTPDEVSKRRALEEEKNIFILKEWAGDVWEDKMKFVTFANFPLFVVSSAATEMSHEDAGQGELCVRSRIRKRT
jgi:hypothetical protein